MLTLLQTWFHRRLGSATGIVSAEVGAGIMLLVPAILARGWRTTDLATAVVALAVTLPAALVVRPGPLTAAPGARARMAGGGDDPAPRERAWAARPWSLGLALRTPRY